MEFDHKYFMDLVGNKGLVFFGWYYAKPNTVISERLFTKSSAVAQQTNHKSQKIMAAAITSKGRDFYAILGVEKTAGQGQIKQAYRWIISRRYLSFKEFEHNFNMTVLHCFVEKSRKVCQILRYVWVTQIKSVENWMPIINSSSGPFS